MSKSAPYLFKSEHHDNWIYRLPEPLPIPQWPCSHIAVDYITKLPNLHNYATILVVVDCFSKVCRLVPLKGLPTAMETATHLVNQKLQSARGQFISQHWQAFCNCLWTHVRITPPSQWPGWAGESEYRTLSKDILQYGTAKMMRVYSLGRVCPKLLNPLLYQSNPFPVWAGQSNTPLPLVRRKLKHLCSWWFHHSREVWEKAHICLQRARSILLTVADVYILHINQASWYDYLHKIWNYLVKKGVPGL